MTYDPQKQLSKNMIEALAKDHSKLHAYSGDAVFRAMRNDFAIADGKGDFTKFLCETSPYKHSPEICELATLESALKKALMVPQEPVFTLEQFEALNKKSLPKSQLIFHPSVQRLDFKTNATSIWCALHCEQSPIPLKIYHDAQQLVVWRQAGTSRFRILGPDEASLLDKAMAGDFYSTLEKSSSELQFKHIDCQNICTYFKGWVEAEFISAVHLMNNIKK